MYIYFDMFEAQTESFRKRRHQATLSIFFDRSVKWNLYFYDEVSG
jgi:hypothetical protein